MNALSRHQRVPGLLAGVILLLSCFLFSSCNYAVRTTTLFGDKRDMIPTVVLSAHNAETAELPLNWRNMTIGGVSAVNFKPSQHFWRLHIFSFSDGEKIGTNKNDNAFYPFDWDKEGDSLVIRDLPMHKLLRADLDLADDEKGIKDRDTLSVMILFHYEEIKEK